MELSKREKELYDFIKSTEELATVDVIKEKLSTKHVGALGILMSKDLIEKKKKRPENDEWEVKKMIRYYVVKEEK